MFRYDEIIKTSLLEVAREALRRAITCGLSPDENHFYISFSTTAKGVSIPPSLKGKYPKEMKIVLQNSFSNLIVDEGSLDKASFSVDLRFSGVISTVVVPFKAIKSFYDPYANFVLQFDFKTDEEEIKDEEKKEPKKQEIKDTRGKVIDFSSFKKK